MICIVTSSFFKWVIPGLFIFVFSTLYSKYVHYKIPLMTGFEPRTSGIRSNRSVNWVTTPTRDINCWYFLSIKPIIGYLFRLGQCLAATCPSSPSRRDLWRKGELLEYPIAKSVSSRWLRVRISLQSRMDRYSNDFTYEILATLMGDFSTKRYLFPFGDIF